MAFSDLDIDIPAQESDLIRKGLVKAKIKTDRGFQNHAAGIYFYKNIPRVDDLCIFEYKDAEQKGFQKIDILNNSHLNDIGKEEYEEYIKMIETENINWDELYEFEDIYQLSNYPGILKEFRVKSIMDIAIVLALIRPGSIEKYDSMKKFIHTEHLLQKKSVEHQKILQDTYGIPVFAEQYKQLGINDGKYRYKKPHSIGYAYVLLVDFLFKNKKK